MLKTQCDASLRLIARIRRSFNNGTHGLRNIPRSTCADLICPCANATIVWTAFDYVLVVAVGDCDLSITYLLPGHIIENCNRYGNDEFV
jgi:hypothetical protein